LVNEEAGSLWFLKFLKQAKIAISARGHIWKPMQPKGLQAIFWAYQFAPHFFDLKIAALRESC
jgi:hypothetical protein